MAITRILTGTYTAGYNLSPAYTALRIKPPGVVDGVAGAAGAYGGAAGGEGGIGVYVGFSAQVTNNGVVLAGAGGMGGNAMNAGGAGGVGGAGVVLAASGYVYNTSTISGGVGGAGGVGGLSGGAGGDGGAGVVLEARGNVRNTGAITGGQGGAGQQGAPDGLRGDGVVLEAGGYVVNVSGLIGGYVGVYAAHGGVVINSGTIRGRGGVAVELKNGGEFIFRGGVLIGIAEAGGGELLVQTGAPGASIEGLGDAMGTINGSTIFTNFGFYDVQDTALTLVGTNTLSAGKELRHEGGGALFLAGSLTNLGEISDTYNGHHALVLTAGASLVNGAGASIRGASGVYVGGPATVTNYGVISGGGGKGSFSVEFKSSADRLIAEAGSTFGGMVRGAGGTLELAGGAGTITNANGTATLSGAVAMAATGFGALVIDAGAAWTTAGNSPLGRSLTVAGSFTVADGGSFAVQGAVVNSGLISLAASTGLAILSVGGAGATLTGGGFVSLGDSAGNEITGTGTLINVDDIITGAGLIGGGSLTLVNGAAGKIVGRGSVGKIIDTGSRTITNAGLIEASKNSSLTVRSAIANSGVLEAVRGTLVLSAAVTGTGVAKIDNGALEALAAFSQNVTFLKAKGVLELADSQGYAGTISGFSTSGGTALDLLDIGFVGAGEVTFSGDATSGVLTVTDGAHTAHITLIGDYRASTFVASSDGHGGTIVGDPTAAATAANRFIAAAAGLGGSAGEAIHTGAAWAVHPPMLGKPRAMIA